MQSILWTLPGAPAGGGRLGNTVLDDTAAARITQVLDILSLVHVWDDCLVTHRSFKNLHSCQVFFFCCFPSEQHFFLSQAVFVHWLLSSRDQPVGERKARVMHAEALGNRQSINQMF